MNKNHPGLAEEGTGARSACQTYATASGQPARYGVIFWVMLALLFVDRLGLLWRFGFRYTDNDQVVFWMGAKDYARGLFHEPCVYGQNYNYMLESLLAAPFFLLRLPCWYLLPVVTSALTVAPYLALAFCFRKRNLLAACVFVALPLLLPTEFGMLTTMPRGFVTGLCFLALFPLLDRLESQRRRFLAAGMIGGLALCVNPNAAPAVAAMILVMQLRDPLRAAVWIYPLLGAVPFLALNYLVSIYYASHPPMHGMSASTLAFQPDLFLDGIEHLDRHFAWLCPLFWTHGSFVLILLLGLAAILAAQRRWPETGALLAAVAIIVAALGIPKIHDGNRSVGYAYSRMFLAAPLLLGIGFSFCSSLIDNQKLALAALLFVCVGAELAKAPTLEATVGEETAARTPPIALRRVEEVRHECEAIDALCHFNNIELVVALPPQHCSYADASFDCVAGEIMFPEYPRTLIYGFDRRAWRSESELATVSSNILFIGGGRRGWQEAARHDHGISVVGDGEFVLHQVRNADGLPLRELLQKLKPVLQSD
jgi:hypothetical protein